jgi:hypothetical protein
MSFHEPVTTPAPVPGLAFPEEVLGSFPQQAAFYDKRHMKKGGKHLIMGGSI